MDHNYRYLLFINEWGPQKRFFHCREFKGRKSWNKSLKNRFSYDRYRESPVYKQVLLQGPINNLFQNSLIHFEQLRSYQMVCSQSACKLFIYLSVGHPSINASIYSFIYPSPFFPYQSFIHPFIFILLYICSVHSFYH